MTGTRIPAQPRKRQPVPRRFRRGLGPGVTRVERHGQHPAEAVAAQGAALSNGRRVRRPSTARPGATRTWCRRGAGICWARRTLGGCGRRHQLIPARWCRGSPSYRRRLGPLTARRRAGSQLHAEERRGRAGRHNYGLPAPHDARRDVVARGRDAAVPAYFALPRRTSVAGEQSKSPGDRRQRSGRQGQCTAKHGYRTWSRSAGQPRLQRRTLTRARLSACGVRDGLPAVVADVDPLGRERRTPPAASRQLVRRTTTSARRTLCDGRLRELWIRPGQPTRPESWTSVPIRRAGGIFAGTFSINCATRSVGPATPT